MTRRHAAGAFTTGATRPFFAYRCWSPPAALRSWPTVPRWCCLPRVTSGRAELRCHGGAPLAVRSRAGGRGGGYPRSVVDASGRRTLTRQAACHDSACATLAALAACESKVGRKPDFRSRPGEFRTLTPQQACPGVRGRKCAVQIRDYSSAANPHSLYLRRRRARSVWPLRPALFAVGLVSFAAVLRAAIDFRKSRSGPPSAAGLVLVARRRPVSTQPCAVEHGTLAVVLLSPSGSRFARRAARGRRRAE